MIFIKIKLSDLANIFSPCSHLASLSSWQLTVGSNQSQLAGLWRLKEASAISSALNHSVFIFLACHLSHLQHIFRIFYCHLLSPLLVVITHFAPWPFWFYPYMLPLLYLYSSLIVLIFLYNQDHRLPFPAASSFLISSSREALQTSFPDLLQSLVDAHCPQPAVLPFLHIQLWSLSFNCLHLKLPPFLSPLWDYAALNKEKTKFSSLINSLPLFYLYIVLSSIP